MQESGLRNLTYGDRDSLGVFQQRPSQGWGTPAEILDVTHATNMFLDHLIAVPDWEQLPVTQVATAVQHPDPLYADRYQQWVPAAISLTRQLWIHTEIRTEATTRAGTRTHAGTDNGTGDGAGTWIAADREPSVEASDGTQDRRSAPKPAKGDAPGTGVYSHTGATTRTEELTLRTGAGPSRAGECPDPTLVTSGLVTYPVPPQWISGNQDNWGGQGDHWSSWHTGTDFSAPCGTPVLAATAGTVQVETAPSGQWYGTWLVKVVTGPTQVATWCAHTQTLDVLPGQLVEAGQQLGQVGNLGNTTGCHLHFEVHLHNGGIYGPDNTDPTPWLATHVGQAVGPDDPRGPGDPGQSDAGASTRVATFNVLGADHTAPGGNAPGYADATTRMGWTVQALDDHRIDFIGMQEFQPPQEDTFRRLTQGAWGLFPSSHGKPGSANVVAWRTTTWRPIATERVAVPYFGGTPARMPYVLLENTDGQRVWVISVHNPADTRGPAQQWRDQAVEIEADLVNRLAADGTPVLLTGDMNDRARFYCDITARTQLHATNDTPAASRALSASTQKTGRPPERRRTSVRESNPTHAPIGAAVDRAASSCSPPADAGIDWILGTANLEFSGHTSTRDGDLARASDHALVYADTTLP